MAPPAGFGRVHDLQALSTEVNAQFFGGRIAFRVRWGRACRRRRRARRAIRFGSWNRDAREIRIHPLLDDRRVPAEFVRYILFHEMLHSEIPRLPAGTGRRDHPAVFRVLERRFPGLPRMRALANDLVVLLG